MSKATMFVLSAFLILAIAGFTIAQTNETNSTDVNSTTVNETNVTTNVTVPANSTEQEKNESVRCAAVLKRVEGRISQYEEDRDKHYARFDNFRDKVAESTDKAEAKGFNVTQLRTDIANLEDKISKLKTDYALFIEKLKNTRNFTCGHSQGEFQASLKEAKDQLKIVKQDAEDIQKFY